MEQVLAVTGKVVGHLRVGILSVELGAFKLAVWTLGLQARKIWVLRHASGRNPVKPREPPNTRLSARRINVDAQTG